MDHIETGYKVMAFFHLLLFLYNGKYMSLIDRMLGMRMVYKYRSLPRQVSFEYMNRNLVWTGLTVWRIYHSRSHTLAHSLNNRSSSCSWCRW